jgi:Carboxypeptidase regulatory-like domain
MLRLKLGVVLMLVSTLAIQAQPTGIIHGVITDESGALVPGAKITVSNPAGPVKTATSGDDGAYSIVGVPPETYTVTATSPGLAQIAPASVDFSGGVRSATLNIQMRVSLERQEVTVQENAGPQISTDPANNAGQLTLHGADLDALSDDPDDLQADLLALAGPAAGPNGGQFFIDGFSSGQLPPKDSIREIRINSNPFSAEYDTSGRGRIEIFTKPGSEKFHGAINLVYSDRIWNARNPFAATPGFPVPASDTKNLMANLSGPIIKNKMSFFIEFARRQQREDQLVTADILDPTCSGLAFLTPCAPLAQSFAVLQPNTFNNVSPRVTYQLTPNISFDVRYRWQGSELDNGGVSGFNLPNSGYNQHGRNQTVQFVETQVVTPAIINESRFQFFSNNTNQAGVNPVLNISVADAFTTGSTFASDYTHQRNYEYQNYTSITHGTHFVKFGGRIRGAQLANYNTNNFTGQFNFTSLQSYALMQQGIAQGLPLSQIVAAGGGPYQFVFAAGQPLINASQVDAGLFIQDDWKMKPNLTVSLGLRYEAQSNIPDHGDWAPRIGIAWGIGTPSGGRLGSPKTVLRAGYGFFYDRFSLTSVVNTNRFNGTNDVSYTIPNPAFYPAAGVPVPALNTLESPQYAESAATYHIDGTYRSPRMQQAAIGIDRQLPRNITVSVNYISSLGEHILRLVNINTPLPGTWNPLNPALSAYPLGFGKGIFDLYESSGFYAQNQLIFNTNARINSKISVFGYYAYGHVNSNTGGASTAASSPSNPYNFSADWGRATYDIRNRVNVNGSIILPYGVRLSPNIIYNSAPPLNIVEGIDQYGDSITSNARPALAPSGFSAPACNQQLARNLSTCLVTGTPYGNFVINPPAGLPVIPINAFSSFRQFNFNLRLSRTWGFGETTAPQNNPRRGPGGGGAGFGRGPGGVGGGRGGPGGPGGGGPPGGFGGFGESSGKRYTLTAGVMFHNIFNTVNPGQIENDLLSPRLGTPLNQANVGGFGGNANAQAFNRRIDLNLRFSF